MAGLFGSAVVVGGGTMGCGIAQLLLESQVSVDLVELDNDRASQARRHVGLGLRSNLAHRDKSIDNQRLDELVEDQLENLSLHVGTSDFGGSLEPDVVIETVVEDLSIKTSILRDLEVIFPSCRVIATNTSSISISALAKPLSDRQKFIGMHFFNPVSRSLLIELVRGVDTSDATVELSQSFVAQLKRESIVVSDSPGFATSRLGVMLGIEAIRMLEENVASADDIDRGMVLGYKFPIGPLKLTDIVGLDVRLAISNYLSSELGDRFSPPQLLRDKVAKGELGKKSGRGFYEW